jgi:hypothetical protein
MMKAIRLQTWTAKEFMADKMDVPTPLKKLGCFKTFEELEATLVDMRINCRKRTAPKAPGPTQQPPPGFSKTTMPAQGTPAAIYDGTHWRTGVYIDTLPSRKRGTGKGKAGMTDDTAEEKLPSRRLVVVEVPPPQRVANASATSKASTETKAQAGKKKAQAKRDPPKLKLIVCDFKNSFAGADRKQHAKPRAA